MESKVTAQPDCMALCPEEMLPELIDHEAEIILARVGQARQ